VFFLLTLSVLGLQCNRVIGYWKWAAAYCECRVLVNSLHAVRRRWWPAATIYMFLEVEMLTSLLINYFIHYNFTRDIMSIDQAINQWKTRTIRRHHAPPRRLCFRRR